MGISTLCFMAALLLEPVGGAQIFVGSGRSHGYRLTAMPVQSSGWSHFPEVMLDKLRSVYGHPLVVWELLDSDEGLDDVLASVNFSDPDVEAACRASLKKLRGRATGAKRVAHHLEGSTLSCNFFFCLVVTFRVLE